MCCSISKVARKIIQGRTISSSQSNDRSNETDGGLLLSNDAPRMHIIDYPPSPSLRGRKACNIPNPRLICVRNLPKTVDAAHLLSFLNQTFANHHGAASASTNTTTASSTPTSRCSTTSSLLLNEAIIRNCLVNGQVAILSCGSAKGASFILHAAAHPTSRGRGLGHPLIYRGERLEIGRPRNFYYTQQRRERLTENAEEGLTISSNRSTTTSTTKRHPMSVQQSPRRRTRSTAVETSSRLNRTNE